jgi:hypothetical protein
LGLDNEHGSAVNGRHGHDLAQRDPPEASVSTTPSARAWLRLPRRRLFVPGMRRPRTDLLGPGKRAPRASGSFEELGRELDRSRRYGHPLFVARISCGGDRASGPERGQQTALLLGSLLRSVDRAWAEGRDVYLILPECDRASGLAMLARIREPLSQLLSAEEQNSISFAAWPDDYLTGGALLSALVRRAAAAKAGDEKRRPEVVPEPDARPLARARMSR